MKVHKASNFELHGLRFRNEQAVSNSFGPRLQTARDLPEVFSKILGAAQRKANRQFAGNVIESSPSSVRKFVNMVQASEPAVSISALEACIRDSASPLTHKYRALFALRNCPGYAAEAALIQGLPAAMRFVAPASGD